MFLGSTHDVGISPTSAAGAVGGVVGGAVGGVILLIAAIVIVAIVTLVRSGFAYYIHIPVLH